MFRSCRQIVALQSQRLAPARVQDDFMIGRLHHVIIDCPDAGALADFYSELLGQPVTYRSDDFCVVSANIETSGVAFQRVDRYVPPRWPDPDYPQQLHFDVMVDDLDVAHERVLAIGARPLEGGDHVYADPVGHPFCIIPRPGWAPPIGRTKGEV